MARTTAGSLRHFKTDKKGNVAVTFGLLIIPMMGMIGAAVDTGRAVHAERKLQAAVDAAATAAAAAMGETDTRREEIARKFFDNNNAGSFTSGPDVKVEINGPNVKVSAEATVPTHFMQLINLLPGVEGPENLPVAAKAEAGQTGRMLEVAMMIDITGSMGWNDAAGNKKINGLRTAGKDLIEIFFPNGADTSGQVRVAIAPMADYVNAGVYAPAVTGLSSAGYFNNLTNLSSTRNGPFSGRYSGSYGRTATNQPVGTQHGATPVNQSVIPGQTSGSQPGQTYTSAHCENPNLPGNGSGPLMYGNGNSAKPMGIKITDGVNGNPTPPAQIMRAVTTSGYYRIDEYDNNGNQQGWEYDGGDPDFDSNDYYIPLPADPSQVTYVRYGSSSRDIGVPIPLNSSNYWDVQNLPPQIKHGTYARIVGWNSSGFRYHRYWVTGYYIPVPESLGTGGGGADPNCTVANDQPNGTLISCVTDRLSSDMTDDAPGTGSFIGPYNQTISGATNKVNYSADGKCFTAGRELPAIIPLTNDRTKLDDFFDTATIGGATPGHLGHAWAWYMLSPKWQSIWPQESHPAQYEDPGVMKAAIIMTDGEYNLEYSNEDSRDQALALCQGMRDAGIKVYTVGFGFGTGNSPARQLLEQCVDMANNPENAYYFPQTANELKDAFRDIGAKLTGGAQRLVVMK